MPLSESDTRSKLIDPAIHARGWGEDLIRREETAGAITIVDGQPRKQFHGRVDYVLRVKVTQDSQPVALALIEAKAENLPPDHGLEQAKLYARCKRMNVPFVFTTNGHLFVEYDCFTGLTTSPKKLDAFPSPLDLRSRYEVHMGFSLSAPEAKPLLTRYSGGEATRRYYQDAAIRAVLEKLARGEKRCLLSLATGAGKTFIAVNLLKKIADAGQLKRALFICDRDELRAQGLGAMQNTFGTDAAEVRRNPDGTNNAKNARVHVATYQTLDVASDDGTANFLTTFYPENYFSHIVLDECHRSAWGKWSQVLTRNSDAIQIGLTATPRQFKVEAGSEDDQISADNIRHFGEPVYEYDMSQGIEDGYLAACEIIRRDIFLDEKGEIEGITAEDLEGKELTDADTGEVLDLSEVAGDYEAPSLEARLLIPKRIQRMCSDLFQHFIASGDPEQKTIIFCVRDRHADAVATVMNNLYAAWCKENDHYRLDPYAFKCTASVGGADYIADLKGAQRHHFIATTVDLLSTGVDVPCVRNIVFFKYVRSPMAFYQMVGRGTRIDPPSGKLMFRVYDYTNATRLFGEDFITKRPSEGGEGGDRPRPPVIQVEGFDVRVSDAGRYILTEVDGKAMPVTVEEYKERLAAKLVEQAPTLESFREAWIHPEARRLLLGTLPDAGRSPLLVRALEEMDAYDLYDVLAELGYGLAPRTRPERADAFTYKHGAWLLTLPPEARETLKALASQFAKAGTDGLESPAVFQTPEVVNAGGLQALRQMGTPAEVLLDTKERMFAV